MSAQSPHFLFVVSLALADPMVMKSFMCS